MCEGKQSTSVNEQKKIEDGTGTGNKNKIYVIKALPKTILIYNLFY